MKRSQHAVINPAINIILRSGSGGQGVPPLAGGDGRPKYKFASFWNRNHTLRTLQRALDNFNNMHDAAKQEHEQPFARQEGTFGSLEQNAVDIKTSTPQNLEEIIVFPSIKDDVLHQICKVFSFPAH
jgi:predicted lipoprotein